MANVFNSVFENSIRIILLLDVFEEPKNLEIIFCVDFMVSYGDVFGLSSNNLNGENPYMFSEFAARRAFVKDALKELVLLGLAKPTNTTEGILYQITESGKEFSKSLESGYALEYQTVARKAVQSVAGQSGSAVISRINKMSAMNLRKGTAR